MHTIVCPKCKAELETDTPLRPNEVLACPSCGSEIKAEPKPLKFTRPSASAVRPQAKAAAATVPAPAAKHAGKPASGIGNIILLLFRIGCFITGTVWACIILGAYGLEPLVYALVLIMLALTTTRVR